MATGHAVIRDQLTGKAWLFAFPGLRHALQRTTNRATSTAFRLCFLYSYLLLLAADFHSIQMILTSFLLMTILYDSRVMSAKKCSMTNQKNQD